MYGTLADALSARKVRCDQRRFEAHAEGQIEGVGKTIRITEIAVHYRLRIAPGDRGKVERALEVHPRGCPAHESVKDAIRITWDAEIEQL